MDSLNHLESSISKAFLLSPGLSYLSVFPSIKTKGNSIICSNLPQVPLNKAWKTSETSTTRAHMRQNHCQWTEMQAQLQALNFSLNPTSEAWTPRNNQVTHTQAFLERFVTRFWVLTLASTGLPKRIILLAREPCIIKSMENHQHLEYAGWQPYFSVFENVLSMQKYLN